jgi:hypothetical protein
VKERQDQTLATSVTASQGAEGERRAMGFCEGGFISLLVAFLPLYSLDVKPLRPLHVAGLDDHVAHRAARARGLLQVGLVQGGVFARVDRE